MQSLSVTHIKDLQETGFNPRAPESFIEGTRKIIEAAAEAGSGQHLPAHITKRTHHSIQINGTNVAPRSSFRRINGDYYLNRVELHSINNNCYNVRNVRATEHVDIVMPNDQTRRTGRVRK